MFNVIDFGNSMKIANAKPHAPLPRYLQNVDSYIAPEILDGKEKKNYSTKALNAGTHVLLTPLTKTHRKTKV